MDDIVEQLRTEAEVTAGAGGGSLLERAADEIVRLRVELEHAQQLRLTTVKAVQDVILVRLRVELEHAQQLRLTTVKAVQDVILAYDEAEARRWRQERNR